TLCRNILCRWTICEQPGCRTAAEFRTAHRLGRNRRRHQSDRTYLYCIYDVSYPVSRRTDLGLTGPHQPGTDWLECGDINVRCRGEKPFNGADARPRPTLCPSRRIY